MHRRQFLSTTAAAMGLVAMPAIRPAGAADRRVLKFVPQADLAVLDPIGTTAYVTRNHALMVFDTLYGVDDKNQPHPQMVEGHVVENDGRLWRLTLRPGLQFHDGTPVLARDVVASINRWGKRDIYGGALMAVIDDLSAPSDRVVEFRLKKPFAHLPAVLGKGAPTIAAIMPERLAKTEATTQITEIVGSGPYRFLAKERNPGALNVYEKFAGYVPRDGAANYLSGGKVAHFERIEWHTLPDASTAAAALQAGEIDWWEQPTSDLTPLLRGNADILVQVQDTTGFAGVMRFNHLQKPFDNPAIRRAFFGGILQSDYLIAAVGEDKALWRDGLGFFHPDSPMASKTAIPAGKPDLARVRQDLAAAGYKGERVVMLATADFPVINLMSQIAADMFQKVGVNLDLQVQDWATVSSRLQSREPIDKGGWSVTCNFAAGIGMFNPAAHSYLRSNGEKALFGWPTIPAIEQLRNDWFDAPDLAAQQKICEEIQKVAYAETPYIPLGLYYQPTAFRADLTGMLKGTPLFYGLRRA